MNRAVFTMPLEVTIINSHGQLVKSAWFTREISQVDISGFSPGFYYLQLNTGEKDISKPFIVR